MFQKYIPSKILQPYIAFYGIINLKKKENESRISEFCLPIGYGHMGFHYLGSFSILQKNKNQNLPRFYTVGQLTQNYHMNSNTDFAELYVATFTPTGLWHFFGLDMQSITDKAIETKLLLKDQLTRFTKEFESKQTPSKRITLIEDLLLNKLQAVQTQLNVIDSAIEMINQSYGCCSINELIIKLGINERYFQKKFKEMIGITPIAYKRIVRFNFMFSELKTETPIDCKGLSELYNYYDFAHFSKDFKKFSGVCPSKFQIERFKFLQELESSKALLG